MASTIQTAPRRLDLLAVPGLRQFLLWKHSRTLLQVLLFGLAALMIVDGLVGSQLAPKNSATVGAWVHYRGFIILALLLAGNLFCAACPFILPRKLARWLGQPTRRWPRALRNKWLALAGLIAILFLYELLDLWSSPWLTAWVIAAILRLRLCWKPSLRATASVCMSAPWVHLTFSIAPPAHCRSPTAVRQSVAVV
jgi:hypothetical protein